MNKLLIIGMVLNQQQAMSDTKKGIAIAAVLGCGFGLIKILDSRQYKKYLLSHTSLLKAVSPFLTDDKIVSLLNHVDLLKLHTIETAIEHIIITHRSTTYAPYNYNILDHFIYVMSDMVFKGVANKIEKALFHRDSNIDTKLLEAALISAFDAIDIHSLVANQNIKLTTYTKLKTLLLQCKNQASKRSSRYSPFLTIRSIYLCLTLHALFEAAELSSATDEALHNLYLELVGQLKLASMLKTDMQSITE